MAKKKTASGENPETLSAPAPVTGRGGSRGPRGIKLVVPAGIQAKIADLGDIYPKLKDAPARYLAILEPGLGLAYQAAFDQLLESLEAERAAKISVLRGVNQQILPAPDESFAVLDDDTPQ